MKIKNPLLYVVAAILITLFLLGSFAAIIHTALKDNVIGTDFATFWVANRAFWVNHQNPYSQDVTLQSQMSIYRRPAYPQEDQLAFAYPLYSLILTAPTALLSLDWSQALWMSFNILLLFTISYFLFFKSLKWIFFIFPLFYPVFFGIVMGNFAIPVSLFLITIISLLVANPTKSAYLQVLSGILLAWITVKPQFVWMYLLFFLLLMVKKRIWNVLISFFCSLLIFIVGTYLLLPGWINAWLRRVTEYAGYTLGSPTITTYLSYLFLPPIPSYLSIVIILLGLIFTGYLFFTWWKEKITALPVLAWCGFMIYLVHPHGLSYDQITFLIPVLLWAASQKKVSFPLVLTWVGGAALSWILYFLTTFKILPAAVNQYPLLFYTLWMVWLFSKTKNMNSEFIIQG